MDSKLRVYLGVILERLKALPNAISLQESFKTIFRLTLTDPP